MILYSCPKEIFTPGHRKNERTYFLREEREQRHEKEKTLHPLFPSEKEFSDMKFALVRKKRLPMEVGGHFADAKKHYANASAQTSGWRE